MHLRERKPGDIIFRPGLDGQRETCVEDLVVERVRGRQDFGSRRPIIGPHVAGTHFHPNGVRIRIGQAPGLVAIFNVPSLAVDLNRVLPIIAGRPEIRDARHHGDRHRGRRRAGARPVGRCGGQAVAAVGELRGLEQP